MSPETMVESVRVAECIHHWDCDYPKDDLVHARCRKCGAEKDFPAVPVEMKRGSHRAKVATVPNAKEALEEKTDKKAATVQEEVSVKKTAGHIFSDRKRMVRKKQEYEARREEIIAEYQRLGNMKATARALGIPAGSLYQLLVRWGVKDKPREKSADVLQSVRAKEGPKRPWFVEELDRVMEEYGRTESLIAFCRGLVLGVAIGRDKRRQ